MSKRDTLSVQIKWFYRTNEVPETVYQFLIQNRQTEHKIYHKALALTEKAALSEAAAANNCEIKKSKRPKLNDGMLRLRELFVSESTDMHPVSVLRGLCKVYQCHDIKDVEEFTANDNTFFFRLSYNPETRRLASTHGEIQVGASHQVRFVCLTHYSPLTQPSCTNSKWKLNDFSPLMVHLSCIYEPQMPNPSTSPKKITTFKIY